MKILHRPLPAGIGIPLAILAFNALLIGALWVAVLEIVSIDRRETIDTAVTRNDNLTIAFEQYAAHILENTDQFLRLLVRHHSRNRGKIDLDQYVADHSIDSMDYADIALADEKGDISATVHHWRSGGTISIADSEHFRVHRDADTGALFIGKPVADRLSGRSVVPLTRRLNKPDGSFAGVAMVLIEHPRLTSVLQDAKLRPLDIISLVGLDGITRARLRDNTPTAGEDISKSPLFAAQARRATGSYAAQGQVDGVKRLFSYRTLPEYPLIATVGASEADVLAPHLRRRAQYFWAAGIASVLIAGFAVLLTGSLAGQRRTIAELARSRARHLATFNQAAVGIAHSDLEGHCLEVNQKLCEITGYAREELIGRKFTDITHPDDVAASVEFRRRVAAAHDPIQSLQREKRYLRKDGSIVWCLLTTSAVCDEAGNFDYLAVIIQDITDRKAAELALSALEQEQRRLAELAETERARLAEAQAVARMGSWETRFPDLTVTWSAQTHRIFETDETRYQPTHTGFLEFVHPEDRAKVDAAFSGSLRDRSSNTIEHRIITSDGRIKIVEERWRTFCDDQGRPTRAVGTCQDITDKKAAEQDRAQLAAIVDSSSDAIVSRGLDGLIVSWNAAAERMFGWTAAEAIGRPAQIMTPPEHAGKFSHLRERVKLGETVPPFETVRMRRDGTRFDAQVSLSAVKDNQGNVVGVATIVRDITDRKHAQQVQAQLAAIVESSNDAIYSRGLDGIIISWNRAAEHMFGWTAAEAIGQPAGILTPPDQRGKFPVIERVMRGENPAPFETIRVRKDGLRFDAHVSLSGIKDDSGRIVAIAVIVRNITDRKLAEAALRDYAERMRQMSQRLSMVEENERRNIHRELHDRIGASLSALKLDLSLIGGMLDAAAQKTVGSRLQRAQQLTGETIARIRDVMGELRPPALDDFGLLAALRTHAQPFAARLGIPVHVNGEEMEPRLANTVETALFRIAQEALTNIAKHAQARQVVISLDSNRDRLTLVIADDGAGFDTNANPPRQDSWGLRTMRERAQAIDADLRIESAPGKGTRVIVEVPREAA